MAFRKLSLASRIVPSMAKLITACERRIASISPAVSRLCRFASLTSEAILTTRTVRPARSKTGV